MRSNKNFIQKCRANPEYAVGRVIMILAVLFVVGEVAGKVQSTVLPDRATEEVLVSVSADIDGESASANPATNLACGQPAK